MAAHTQHGGTEISQTRTVLRDDYRSSKEKGSIVRARVRATTLSWHMQRLRV